MFGFWLLPEFVPNSTVGVLIKKVNEIFGYFGGLFIYPIWRWQTLKDGDSDTEQHPDDAEILRLKLDD